MTTALKTTLKTQWERNLKSKMRQISEGENWKTAKADYSKRSLKMPNKTFSEIDLVNECLVDEKRTKAFEAAIKNLVKPSHTVLDLGTGSGILALFAARQGAKKVIAVEYDDFISKTAKENIKNNGFENKIEVVTADARNFRFPKSKKFDVVIAEMLTTGIVDEFQVQAVNNLHKRRLVSKNTIFIPKCEETYISLCRANFQIYGFKMQMVRHLWDNYRSNQKTIMLSKPRLLNSVYFSKRTNEDFKAVISLKAEKSGKINAVYLTSRTVLAKGVFLKDTKTLNAPVIVPIEERKILAGKTVKIKINYAFGRGYENFYAEVV